MYGNNSQLNIPDERIYWVFRPVRELGYCPVQDSPGTKQYVKYQINDPMLKVAYFAFKGEPDDPKQALYVGMGKPQRPLWRYAGSGRVKCEMVMCSDPKGVFTIEVLAISWDWSRIAVFENFLCTTLHPILNKIKNPKLNYQLSEYEDSKNLWKKNYAERFKSLIV